jgi:hypothetical protein
MATTLDKYISDLENKGANLDKFLRDTIAKNESKIVGFIRTRLYQTGYDGDGNLIGYYTASTEAKKRDNNQRASHITLRDTGDFYRGMFAEYRPGQVFISSSDRKTPELISEYGDGILELTELEQEIVMDTMIEAELIKYINELGNIVSVST